MCNLLSQRELAAPFQQCYHKTRRLLYRRPYNTNQPYTALRDRSDNPLPPLSPKTAQRHRRQKIFLFLKIVSKSSYDIFISTTPFMPPYPFRRDVRFCVSVFSPVPFIFICRFFRNSETQHLTRDAPTHRSVSTRYRLPSRLSSGITENTTLTMRRMSPIERMSRTEKSTIGGTAEMSEAKNAFDFLFA